MLRALIYSVMPFQLLRLIIVEWQDELRMTYEAVVAYFRHNPSNRLHVLKKINTLVRITGIGIENRTWDTLTTM
jgi:hypothetical protein